MASYLVAAAAQDRLLARYNITATLTDGDMDLASDELDALYPFIGVLYDADQARRFPRSIEPDGSTGDGTVPSNILDAVSLLALDLVDDSGPPVTAESAGGVSVTYAVPKRHVNRRRVDALVHPYLRTRGQSA